MLKIAILDDYAHIALQSADWSCLDAQAEITVLDRHLSESEAAEILRPFEVLCTVRDRMGLPRRLLERLPNLELITIIGPSLPNLDMAAATELGILISHSNPANPAMARAMNATPELAWGLLIATVARTKGVPALLSARVSDCARELPSVAASSTTLSSSLGSSRPD